MRFLFENELIRFRAMEPTDVELLYFWENDPEHWSSGSTLQPLSKSAMEAYVEESHKSLYELGAMRLMIEEVRERRAIGAVDLYDYDAYNRRVAVGLLIETSYRGRGFGSSAIKMISDYALCHLRLRLVYAHIDRQNKPSQAAFISAGFREVASLPLWHWNGEEYSDLLVYTKSAD